MFQKLNARGESVWFDFVTSAKHPGLFFCVARFICHDILKSESMKYSITTACKPATFEGLPLLRSFQKRIFSL